MTDRDLARALRSGGVPASHACALLFDAYGETLYRHCRLALRDTDVARTALRDTFVVARAHIDQLPDPDRLRDWLFAIADAECERHRATVEAALEERPAQPGCPGAAGTAGGPRSETLRVRVLSCVTAPELAGYRAHVARRGDSFDRRGFPRPPGHQRPARPSSYLLPGLIVAVCALLAMALVLIEFTGIATVPATTWVIGPVPPPN
ncbi:hypothetical protein HDA32_005090 [Spinactinospora alkalitolerans]|uniref:RNA polymerase sigma-70 region 2 domain-containing protein n=1 Tax=Spinactinospora alkalitolerans TaxID=687207 RepID=A0A852U7R9_9ACTN|nr:sigma-70 family RNA polymerase sigma factor [Spinactinospora alkalitolerans]NYE49970.1 hypothetical protein [Spinactinospora alkalitolerans]